MGAGTTVIIIILLFYYYSILLFCCYYSNLRPSSCAPHLLQRPESTPGNPTGRHAGWWRALELGPWDAPNLKAGDPVRWGQWELPRALCPLGLLSSALWTESAIPGYFSFSPGTALGPQTETIVTFHFDVLGKPHTSWLLPNMVKG